ncbi:hypothetical protein GJR88_04211 [Dietzia sp. DQ12-45-1b]|nr:hypothetical protein GJR88_04211 [Dietzia sp. DQ12-45-1b]
MLSAVVLVAGCGGEVTNTEPTGADTTNPSSSARTTTSQTATSTVHRAPETTTAATAAAGAPAATPAVGGPTLIECIYGGGAWTENGFFTDGSYGYHPQCAALRNEQMAANPYRCPQTDHYVPDLSHCANPNGISVSTEVQNGPSVDSPEETREPLESPVEPEAVEAP